MVWESFVTSFVYFDVSSFYLKVFKVSNFRERLKTGPLYLSLFRNF